MTVQISSLLHHHIIFASEILKVMLYFLFLIFKKMYYKIYTQNVWPLRCTDQNVISHFPLGSTTKTKITCHSTVLSS